MDVMRTLIMNADQFSLIVKHVPMLGLLDLNSDLNSEIREWCNNNLKGGATLKCRFLSIKESLNMSNGACNAWPRRLEWRIVFQHKKDAVLFKLFWM